MYERKKQGWEFGFLCNDLLISFVCFSVLLVLPLDPLSPSNEVLRPSRQLSGRQVGCRVGFGWCSRVLAVENPPRLPLRLHLASLSSNSADSVSLFVGPAVCDIRTLHAG